jgi:hypothetical protein
LILLLKVQESLSSRIEAAGILLPTGRIGGLHNPAWRLLLAILFLRVIQSGSPDHNVQGQQL